MASAGIRKTPTGRYKVWWRLDDASQGSQTFDTRDEARDFKHDLLTRLTRGSWVDPRLGKQLFEIWAREWWEVWSTDPDRSPATLQATEGRLRRYLPPFFGQRQLRGITVSMVRRWQNELRGTVGHDTVLACRSVLNRILQAAEDDRRIDANPVRKVPAPKPPVDPAALLGRAKRRTYSPEEFGRLLAGVRPFYPDHLLSLVGTGLRAGELLGLRAHRVDLAARRLEILEVRYEAGKFGRGYKNRPKSATSIRVVPLASQVANAIARQLPNGCPPSTLVFAGPGAATASRPALGQRCPATTFTAPTTPPSRGSPTQPPPWPTPPSGCCGRSRTPVQIRLRRRSAISSPAAAPPSAPSTMRSGSWRRPGWRLGRMSAMASRRVGRRPTPRAIALSTT
jgi:integrase